MILSYGFSHFYIKTKWHDPFFPYRKQTPLLHVGKVPQDGFLRNTHTKHSNTRLSVTHSGRAFSRLSQLLFPVWKTLAYPASRTSSGGGENYFAMQSRDGVVPRVLTSGNQACQAVGGCVHAWVCYEMASELVKTFVFLPL